MYILNSELRVTTSIIYGAMSQLNDEVLSQHSETHNHRSIRFLISHTNVLIGTLGYTNC